MKAVVYGHTGVVGTQTYRWLGRIPNLEVAGVSLDQQDGNPADPDWVFICVPTPNAQSLDGNLQWQSLEAIGNALSKVDVDNVDPLNVVIRSTVLPGTCKQLAMSLANWNIFHWPEFLSARTAERDFNNPSLVVIGGDREIFFGTWEKYMPPTWAGNFWCTDLTTAEIIKYAHNTHGAMQIIFANMLWDICGKSGGDFKSIRIAMNALGYISENTTDTYWNIFKDGYRGFDGACFPKDVAALRHWLGDKAELLEGIERANARLRGKDAT